VYFEAFDMNLARAVEWAKRMVEQLLLLQSRAQMQLNVGSGLHELMNNRRVSRLYLIRLQN
jgi:hypothetical protein